MLSIAVLRVIWWLLVGVVLMGFVITDGFDFGAAALLPLVAKSEMEKRIVLNAIGPFWEGNQVWIILGGGALFAAWPFVYSVSFSGFYLLILLLLLTMGISRPVSFKYRSKLKNPAWRQFWDRMVVVGGVCPALIFGILIGNALLGVPFYFDDSLRMFYTGSFLGLFRPFALLCGLVSLAMITMHGGLYLTIKTEGDLRNRAIYWAKIASVAFIILFAIAGLWVAFGIKGYQVISGVSPFGFSNPLQKQVMAVPGGWLHNYQLYPVTMIAPLLGFIGALGVYFLADKGNAYLAFIASSVVIIGTIATVGFSMFPFILPSTTLISSLLVWDASSTKLTLLLMLISVIIFLPLILIYTSWVYYALRGKVGKEEVEANKQAY